MKAYTTKQRALIMNIFTRNAEGSFTAEALFDSLRTSGVCKSTIYRNLERLVEEGRLIRALSADGSCNVYRISGKPDCNGHLHLVCSKCKGVIHLSNADSEQMNELIKNKYVFSVNENTTVINGVCENCQKN